MNEQIPRDYVERPVRISDMNFNLSVTDALKIGTLLVGCGALVWQVNATSEEFDKFAKVTEKKNDALQADIDAQVAILDVLREKDINQGRDIKEINKDVSDIIKLLEAMQKSQFDDRILKRQMLELLKEKE